MDSLFKVFEKTHPLIHLQFVHNQPLTKDVTAIASGNGPDVIWLWDNANPIANWALNGLIQPLDKYVATSHYDLNNLVPAAVQQVSWRGHVWGLPLVADTFWLWYKVKDFKAAGLDPRHPPATFDELMADAVKLTTRSGSGRILRLGYELPPYINPNGASFYNAVFGASLYNANGTNVTPDSPAALAAWNELRREAALYDKLYSHNQIVRFNGSIQGTFFTPQDPFLTDRIAMRIDNDGLPSEVGQLKPQWKYGVDYAVAPLPYPKGNATFADHAPVATYPLVITKSSKHPAQAWEFIQWLQAPQQTVALAAYLDNLPQYKSALASPQLAKLPGFGPLLSLVRTKITLVSDPPSPVLDQYVNTINSYSDAILTGKTTAASAMKEVHQRIQPQLDKLLKGH